MTIAKSIKSKNLLYRYKDKYVYFIKIYSEDMVDRLTMWLFYKGIDQELNI